MDVNSIPNVDAKEVLKKDETLKTEINKLDVSEKMKNREISFVELKLENVTYAPITARVTNAENHGSRDAKKNLENRSVVLSNVSTKISPHKLTAWMGPSGSGKSSLISVAANLIPRSDLMDGSKILVNGDEGIIPKKLVSVVWQEDLMLSNLTVEETIYFAARLRTPEAEFCDEEVSILVEETMSNLGLIHIRDSLVGTPGGGNGGGGGGRKKGGARSRGGGGASGGGESRRGISGGERKRVAVASELVVKPPLLLLDEPTSGLDATTARDLVQTLKTLTDMGHSIAVVIHQPRTEIYNMFDHLLLLSRGHTVYDGSPQLIRDFLESVPNAIPLPPETGIADWIMDTVKAVDEENKYEEEHVLSTVSRISDLVNPEIGSDDVVEVEMVAHQGRKSILGSHWSKLVLQKRQLGHGTKVEESILSASLIQMSSLRELESSPKFATGFWKQLKLLTKRTLKQQRGEKITQTAVLLTVAYIFFTAFFWWRMPDNTAYVFSRNSLLFFMVIVQSNGIVTTSIAVFQRERTLMARERAKKMYGVFPFFVAKTISDMTNNVMLPCLYGAVAYHCANLRPEWDAYLRFILVYYLTMGAAQSMGLLFSIAIPNIEISLILAPPITLFFIIMGGFYIPFNDMHWGIRWATWSSFARYGYSAMLVNEFSGRSIPCADEGEVSIAIGTSSVNGTEVCPISGDDVIEALGINGPLATSYWFGVGMIFLLQCSFRTLSYILLRRSK